MHTDQQIEKSVSALIQHIRSNPRFERLSPWMDRISEVQEEAERVLVSFQSPDLHSLFTNDLAEMFEQAFSDFRGAHKSFELQRVATISLPVETPDPRMRFESFYSGASNRLALAASEMICETLSKQYNPLLIYGEIGLGKTHLLHAITHRLYEQHPNLDIILITAENLMQVFFDVSSQGKTQTLLDRLSTADVLLIDGIETLLNQNQLQSFLTDVFNNLYAKEKQLIFSAAKAPNYLSGFLPALQSRLQWGLVVEIEAPTALMRKHIILQKSRDYGLSLSDEIIDYLANNTFGPVRELEGILNSLQSRVDLLKEEIHLTLVQDIVGASSYHPPRTIILQDVERYVCDRFGVTSKDLHSKSRARSIAFPRQVGMYLAQTMTSASLEEIGQFYGGRDHSTVKHGCEKIRKLTKTDQNLRNLINDFRRSLSMIRK